MQIVGIQLADTGRDSIVLFPIGTFRTTKYPKVDLSMAVAEQVVENFNNRVLRRDIRVDADHKFAEAAAWFTGLSIGTYTDSETGEDRPGVIASVAWTEAGTKLLDDKAYRYLSAAIGRYRDPDSGKKYDNVLLAVSMTNDPVLPVPAIGEALIALSDMPELTFAFADLDITPDDAPEDEPDPDDTEDEPTPGAAEMAAPREDDDTASTPTETVDDLLARYDALMSEMDDMASGSSGVKAMRTLARETRAKLAAILSRKGGTEMSDSPEYLELSEKYDAVTTELAEVRAAKRAERVTTILDLAVAKGATEPLKLALAATMELCDEAVDAVAEVVDALEVVPVEPAGEQENPAAEEVALSNEATHVASLMGVDPETLKSI